MSLDEHTQPPSRKASKGGMRKAEKKPYNGLSERKEKKWTRNDNKRGIYE